MEQRADLTFKGNLGEGRHGWLRLTPAYSAEMVRRYLPGLARKGGGERAGAEVVFDPFSGSGTTPLVAAQAGHEACALEVNPFLVWLAKAKTARYDPATVKEVRRAGEHLIGLFRSGEAPRADPPPITDIERWWDEAALGFLRSVKGGIEQYRLRRRHRRRHRRRSLASAAGGGNAGKVVDLLRVAFCRTLAKLSDAAFDHQSISPGIDFSPRVHPRGFFLAEKNYSFVGPCARSPDLSIRKAPRVLLCPPESLASWEAPASPAVRMFSAALMSRS